MTDTPAAPSVDGKTFWRTLGQRATGMTIVTADSDEGPTGFLGLSAAHVTADPATMLVSIDRKTSALAGVLSRRHFAINYLPAGAESIADAFSGKAGISGAERFAAGEWTTLASGAPVLKSALGVFDCAVEDIIERGNISIVIGRVLAAQASAEGEPLIFFRGKMWRGVGEAA
ncbi:flavin reductase family protein [Kaistia dalseonensis]|uniref:Flavin reductase (DIM6/NTAB) family NADH-FMN oxidoreductase RutF n=1 Tax=Kaistia dalseonensis TaxID=410840 RepID=A0ABU0H9W6_9HYPH|nr:flavin reductase family protein [Kaistia dalseonensis]MCX5496494.1 flavin reductase family protein [Kaistia dalseonensis]MDQ0439116.1 flavin reductase (DIM6/NTAB) family NADH-FMN oxidoreductase RutF [Kaistia dalseonensis]